MGEAKRRKERMKREQWPLTAADGGLALEWVLYKRTKSLPCFLCGSADIAGRETFFPDESFGRRIGGPPRAFVVDLCCDCYFKEDCGRLIEQKLLHELGPVQ